MAYIGFDETWKPVYIDNQCTHYSVSDMGRVKNNKTGNIIKPFKVHNKYYVVTFTLIDDKGNKYKKYKTLSRVVAETFIPIPQKYIEAGYTADTLEVDHIRDGDPLNHEDNTIYNLQWLTHLENVQKAQKYGLYEKVWVKGMKKPEWGLPGDLNPTAKYTDEQARRVCERLVQNKLTYDEIVDDTNTSMDFVIKIRMGKLRCHISKDYNFEHYDRVKGLKYEPKLLKDMDELILSGKDNKTIREILNLEDNKTTTALISSHRKKCGKNLEKRRVFPKEFLTRLDDLIMSGTGNAEIRDILKLENNSTTQSLIAAHRMKLKKPVNR